MSTAQAVPSSAQPKPRSLSKKDFGAMVGGLINSDLVKDEASALAMLSLVQAAYDAGKINEEQFLKSESDLVRILSFKPQSYGGEEGETPASDQLLSLLKEREELERALDTLADAAAAGKITQDSYEKLYVADSEKLSAVLSKIDAVAREASSSATLRAGTAGEFSPAAYATSASQSEASPAAPAEPPSPRAGSPAQAPVPASQKAAPEARSFLSILSSSLDLNRTRALPGRVEELKGQVTTPRPAFPAAVESDLAQAKRDVASLSEQMRDLRGKFDEWSAKAPSPQGSLQQSASGQELLAQFSDLSRKVADFETRIVGAESSLRDRFAQMAELVSKVSEVSEAVQLSRQAARQSEDVRKQLLRTEKLADLMGRTFVSSTKKFNELEEFKHRQQILSASLSALAESLKQLTLRMREQDPRALSGLRAEVRALRAEVERLKGERQAAFPPQAAQAGVPGQKP